VKVVELASEAYGIQSDHVAWLIGETVEWTGAQEEASFPVVNDDNTCDRVFIATDRGLLDVRISFTQSGRNVKVEGSMTSWADVGAGVVFEVESVGRPNIRSRATLSLPSRGGLFIDRPNPEAMGRTPAQAWDEFMRAVTTPRGFGYESPPSPPV
jgi:hypothetical protein